MPKFLLDANVSPDRDIAEAWYFKERGKVGVLFLRTRLQTVEHVNTVLAPFIEAKILSRKSLRRH